VRLVDCFIADEGRKKGARGGIRPAKCLFCTPRHNVFQSALVNNFFPRSILFCIASPTELAMNVEATDCTFDLWNPYSLLGQKKSITLLEKNEVL
jgi:hypothetical protein